MLRKDPKFDRMAERKVTFPWTVKIGRMNSWIRNFKRLVTSRMRRALFALKSWKHAIQAIRVVGCPQIFPTFFPVSRTLVLLQVYHIFEEPLEADNSKRLFSSFCFRWTWYDTCMIENLTKCAHVSRWTHFSYRPFDTLQFCFCHCQLKYEISCITRWVYLFRLVSDHFRNGSFLDDSFSFSNFNSQLTRVGPNASRPSTETLLIDKSE